MIEKCRGSPAVIKFLGEEFGGCLITDFWRAYDRVTAKSRQYCLAHLLREIHDVGGRNGCATTTENLLSFDRNVDRFSGGCEPGLSGDPLSQRRAGRLAGRLGMGDDMLALLPDSRKARLTAYVDATNRLSGQHRDDVV